MEGPEMSGLKITCLECGQTNRVPADRVAAGPKCGTCGAALTGPKVRALDFRTLEKAAKTDDLPLLVDYWAPWCGPCRMMAPQFEQAARMVAPQVRLAKIDTQSNPDATVRWNIRGIPAFILFRGGREVARLSGARPAAGVVDFLRQNGALG